MKQYIVDAFTNRLFSGNQAAVCVLDAWPDDRLMQRIALENNFSETAFTVREGNAWRLRWFTPGGEIDFCGHATLGTAWVLFHFYCQDASRILFQTQVGVLAVRRQDDWIRMDFPAYRLNPIPVTDAMIEALGCTPLEAYLDRDLLLVLDSEETVKALRPDQDKLKALDGLLTCVTAPGKDYDCVSRVFAPKLSIPEDPVTGSAHCMIAPYWAKRLGKEELFCSQPSERRGTLRAKMSKDRVLISGQAVLFAEAELHI